MRRRRPQRSLARRQHRATGITVALFVLFIVLSGLALNHSHQLGLDDRHVRSAGLLDWYGVEGAAEVRDFRVGGRWLSAAGSHWYLDGLVVAEAKAPVGAVAAAGGLLLAETNTVTLLTGDGDLVERLAWYVQQRGAIDAIGVAADGRAALRAGGRTWLADAQLLDWVAADVPPGEIRWSEADSAPREVRQAVQRAHRGQALSYETVMLDLHSGRFFGPWGVLVYDLLALALASLAVSGLVLWWRGRRNGREHLRRPHVHRRQRR